MNGSFWTSDRAWRFSDRREAGRRLAEKLSHYASTGSGSDPAAPVVVLALPRGGVPVAYEVAKALAADLDVFLVRKLGVPGHEELAMGAIASGGIRVLNEDVVQALRIPPSAIDSVTASESDTLHRREQAYRGDRTRPDVRGKIVILVDDGLATGATMRAAIAALWKQEPSRIVVAVPVAPPEVCEALKSEADEVVCAATPNRFSGVSAWYDDFTQTEDAEVRDLLLNAVPRANL